MDIVSGIPGAFVGYLPDHPEFVAVVNIGEGQRGMRPFEMERFKLVGRRDAPDILASFARAASPSGAKKPRLKATKNQRTPAIPHPIERSRKMDLDA